MRIELLGDRYHYELLDSGPASAEGAPESSPGSVTAPIDTVLFLHGFSQSGETWRPVIEAMREAGNRIPLRFVLLDLIGHGRSDRPRIDAPYSLDHIVAVVDEFRRRLSEDSPHSAGGRLHLVGYSMGGRIALCYAIQHQHSLASLVLESASFGQQTPEARAAFMNRDRDLAERLRASTSEEFAQWWAAMPVLATQSDLPPTSQASVAEMRAGNDTDALARITRGAGQGVMPDLFDAVGDLQIPLLYVCGEKDTKYSAIAAALEQRWGVDVRRFPAGHNVHLELPADYARMLMDFYTDRSSDDGHARR